MLHDHTYRAPVLTGGTNFPVTGLGAMTPIGQNAILQANFSEYRVTKVTIELIPIANQANNQGILYVLRNPMYNGVGNPVFSPDWNAISEKIGVGNLRDGNVILPVPYNSAGGFQFAGVLPAQYASPPVTNGWPQISIYVTGAANATNVLNVRIRTQLEVVPLSGTITERLAPTSPPPNMRVMQQIERAHRAVDASGSWFTGTQAFADTMSSLMSAAGSALRLTYGGMQMARSMGWQSGRGVSYGGQSSLAAGNAGRLLRY